MKHDLETRMCDVVLDQETMGNGETMDFQTWLNEEADIPMQDDNGNWYDAETGIPFAAVRKYPRRNYRSSKHAADIETARQEARISGWPELTGSTRQKWWAVQIRRDLIATVPTELRNIAAHISTSASWWIDNRDLGVEFFERVKEFDKEVQRRQEAVRLYDLAKQAMQKAEEAKKLEGFSAAAAEQKAVYEGNIARLAPFHGQPLGQKIGDFTDGDVRIRVFQNFATNTLLYMADTPSGKQAFSIDSYD